MNYLTFQNKVYAFNLFEQWVNFTRKIIFFILNYMTLSFIFKVLHIDERLKK